MTPSGDFSLIGKPLRVTCQKTAHKTVATSILGVVCALSGPDTSTSDFTKVGAPASDAIVPMADSMVYLGSILTAHGSIHRELGRRIASAKADFDTLAKVWTHSSLTWSRKLRIYSSLVESKLFYALASCCLTRADERRLDGFQNRCLRKIMGIKSAFISRVSNLAVREKAQHRAASNQVIQIAKL